MNYLDQFIGFFSSGRSQSLGQFSEALQTDLRTTKSHFDQDGVTFDIEPVSVKEFRKDTGTHEVIRYVGTFIYGFRKDGVFHEIPGDLSTKTERKQNTDGEVVFYRNKDSNQIEGIHESFADNSWGTPPKKSGKLWRILGTVILVILVGSAYGVLKPQFARIRAEWSSRARQKDIRIIEPSRQAAMDRTGQQIFRNKTYGYTLSISSADIALSNEIRELASYAYSVKIDDKNGDFLANIEVLDPNIFPGDSEKNKKIREAYALPLREYVAHISELNKDNLDLSARTSAPIGGISGYTISARNFFNDDSGGYVFNDGFPVHAFVFLEYKGLKYQFEIPESLGHRGREIINSIKFD